MLYCLTPIYVADNNEKNCIQTIINNISAIGIEQLVVKRKSSNHIERYLTPICVLIRYTNLCLRVWNQFVSLWLHWGAIIEKSSIIINAARNGLLCGFVYINLHQIV